MPPKRDKKRQFSEEDERQHKLREIEECQRVRKEAVIRSNKKVIDEMRLENEKLRKEVSDVLRIDETINKDALKGKDWTTLEKKTVKEACEIVEQRTFLKKKQLNALVYKEEKLRLRVQQLKEKYAKAQMENPLHININEDDDEHLQELETCLENADVKLKVAEFTTDTLQKLKKHLHEESLTYEIRLDKLEKEVKEKNNTLEDLLAAYRKACSWRSKAQDLLYAKTEEAQTNLELREHEISELKALVEEDTIRRESASVPFLVQDMSQLSEMIEEVVDKEPPIYQSLMKCLTEVTGVSTAEELEEKFTQMLNIKSYLEKHKTEVEARVQKVQQELDQMQAELEHMSFTGAEEATKQQMEVDELDESLHALEERDKTATVEVDVKKSEMKQLCYHILSISSMVPSLNYKRPRKKADPASPHYALDLIKELEKKFNVLKETLEGVEFEDIERKIEQERFFERLKTCMRKHIPIEQKGERRGSATRDTEDSDEDENINLALTREAHKKASLKLVEEHKKPYGEEW